MSALDCIEKSNDENNDKANNIHATCIFEDGVSLTVAYKDYDSIG